MLHGLQDLSSATGDWTQALGRESAVLTTKLPGNSLHCVSKIDFWVYFTNVQLGNLQIIFEQTPEQASDPDLLSQGKGLNAGAHEWGKGRRGDKDVSKDLLVEMG